MNHRPLLLQLAHELDTFIHSFTSSDMNKQLILRKNEEKRIVAGHPWAFSNEIRETKGDPAIGDVVELRTAGGISLGIGFYNPHSLIAFRMLSTVAEEIDAGFFEQRLSQATDLRRLLLGEADAFRVVHGEGDYLPGLIIDKFNDLLVVQAMSYGMDARLPLICDALETIFHPSGIVERNESPLRTLENLPLKKSILRGKASPTVITEHGLRYTVDVLEGQKTGFFLDQRENRMAARRFCRNASVLDCFCNEGGFSLNAAQAGAKTVIGVDSSDRAVERASANAALNACTVATFEQADVFEKLKSLDPGRTSFDVIVLDPPSFTRSRKNVQTAKKGYKELHQGALRLLRRGGILLSASCSHHIEPDVFLGIIDQTARESGRQLQLLEWRGAAPDHPSLPQVPETRYLKFGIFRML